MVLERFRRPRRVAVGLLSCFGKLPFHEEFLRVALDSAEAGRVVDLVEGAHQLIVDGDARRDDGPELRILQTLDDGQTVACALIRPSSDAKGRQYPICVFTFQDAAPLQQASHLLPLWTEPLWASLSEVALKPHFDSSERFGQTLAEAASALPVADGLEAQFAAQTAVAVDSPWQVLTGVAADHSAGWARKLAQMADLVRNAGNTFSVAVSIPLAVSVQSGVMLAPPVKMAIWAHLLGTAFALSQPWLALAQVVDRATSTVQSVCLFARDLTARDLAWLMAGVGPAPIEDLTAAWDDEPLTEHAQQALGRLVDPAPRSLANLWSMEI